MKTALVIARAVAFRSDARRRICCLFECVFWRIFSYYMTTTCRISKKKQQIFSQEGTKHRSESSETALTLLLEPPDPNLFEVCVFQALWNHLYPYKREFVFIFSLS